MSPLNCPECGRFLKHCGSTGLGHPIFDRDLNWGECAVHGDVEWES